MGILKSFLLPKSVLTVNFEPRSGQSEDDKIRICCFSDKLIHMLICDLKLKENTCCNGRQFICNCSKYNSCDKVQNTMVEV